MTALVSKDISHAIPLLLLPTPDPTITRVSHLLCPTTITCRALGPHASVSWKPRLTIAPSSLVWQSRFLAMQARANLARQLAPPGASPHAASTRGLRRPAAPLLKAPGRQVACAAAKKKVKKLAAQPAAEAAPAAESQQQPQQGLQNYAPLDETEAAAAAAEGLLAEEAIGEGAQAAAATAEVEVVAAPPARQQGMRAVQQQQVGRHAAPHATVQRGRLCSKERPAALACARAAALRAEGTVC